MASMIAEGEFGLVLASRILGIGALAGGMPLYKYIANRFLTFTQNLLVGHKLSEYHTGYRAWSKKTLESLPLLNNSDDFVLITKCWRKRYIKALESANYLVRPVIFRKPLRSTSNVALSMAWVFYTRQSNSACNV